MSKYGNTKCVASDGKSFASMRERKRYEDLLVLWRMGKITCLECQRRYELIPKQEGERACIYIADFVYHDIAEGKKLGALHVEDTKGFRTKDYIIKRKLMLWVHKIRIEEL